MCQELETIPFNVYIQGDPSASGDRWMRTIRPFVLRGRRAVQGSKSPASDHTDEAGTGNKRVFGGIGVTNRQQIGVIEFVIVAIRQVQMFQSKLSLNQPQKFRHLHKL